VTFIRSDNCNIDHAPGPVEIWDRDRKVDLIRIDAKQPVTVVFSAEPDAIIVGHRQGSIFSPGRYEAQFDLRPMSDPARVESMVIPRPDESRRPD